MTPRHLMLSFSGTRSHNSRFSNLGWLRTSAPSRRSPVGAMSPIPDRATITDKLPADRRWRARMSALLLKVMNMA